MTKFGHIIILLLIVECIVIYAVSQFEKIPTFLQGCTVDVTLQ